MNEIVDPDSLRAHYGPVNPIALRKVMTRLDKHARHFISLSPFLVLATSDPEGHVDASPRGDAPGFVTPLDDLTLLIPDRMGNNRVDSFNNVVRSPGVALLFMVPGIDETLRVNGTARITTDAELLAPAAVRGRAPSSGLIVTISEVYFHCGKALMRSKLWDPQRQVERAGFPSLGRIVAEQTSTDVAEAEHRIAEGYRTRLY